MFEINFSLVQCLRAETVNKTDSPQILNEVSTAELEASLWTN